MWCHIFGRLACSNDGRNSAGIFWHSLDLWCVAVASSVETQLLKHNSLGDIKACVLYVKQRKALDGFVSAAQQLPLQNWCGVSATQWIIWTYHIVTSVCSLSAPQTWTDDNITFNIQWKDMNKKIYLGEKLLTCYQLVYVCVLMCVLWQIEKLDIAHRIWKQDLYIFHLSLKLLISFLHTLHNSFKCNEKSSAVSIHPALNSKITWSLKNLSETRANRVQENPCALCF